MNRLLENPTAISAPRIEPGRDKTQRVITIAGVPIVTVTQTDAQDNLTTVDALATQWSQAIGSAITIVPRAIASLLVIGLFWAIATFVRWLMRLVFRHIVEDLTIENLIKQVAYYAVWILGIIVALDALRDPRSYKNYELSSANLTFAYLCNCSIV
ncbi:MAG: hypothetical protein MUC48_03620 [Leptolyngbya sp. Prado105]|jgi:small-conductance mechanosensitive channel|nr:hypothetical protein [Leptolyngbya sp. Prado105]